MQRWRFLWVDQPEGSCFLSFLSTQFCQDLSPEKKVKVWSPLGEKGVTFIPALPSTGGPSPRTWNLFQMLGSPALIDALCLLVQERLREEGGTGLFQKMVGEVNSACALCP